MWLDANFSKWLTAYDIFEILHPRRPFHAQRGFGIGEEYPAYKVFEYHNVRWGDDDGAINVGLAWMIKF